jgi:PD-(D/E)XK nuclease superfamily
MTPEQAAQKYPNLFAIGSDGVLEIYADNHTLSSFRKCPGYFEEFILNHRRLKEGRVWALEFGQYFHKVMEFFYQAQHCNWTGTWTYYDTTGEKPVHYSCEQNLQNFIEITRVQWANYDLEYFGQPLWYDKKKKKNVPFSTYEKLGGYTGAFNLFLQYYINHFQQERMRVVGTELSFGRAREVPIGSITQKWAAESPSDFVHEEEICRLYYCGRIDLVVDNGVVIGPLDFKTTSYFDGTESNDFKPHDGQQGYVYSAQKMLPEELVKQGRMCNSAMIKHISLTQTSEDTTGRDRFKTTIKSYTPAEMEEWRLRQVATFTAIYRHVILEEPIWWNTDVCGSWFYFQDCPYKQLHNLPPMSRSSLDGNLYKIGEAWSHERT